MRKGWILLDKILTIEDLLSQLREPKNKHLNPFEELLPEARKLLGLDSELDAISLEALLIQAIIYCESNNTSIYGINTVRGKYGI